MEVFVAGGTGVIGRRVVPHLLSAGHDVTVVARGPGVAATVRGRGARPVQVDLFDPDPLRAAVAGHGAVVNLATRIPAGSEAILAGAWEENDRLRREASANLVDAALAAGAAVYVQESIGFLYADHGDGWIEEGDRVEPATFTASALDAEAQAARFARSGGCGVALRFAQFVAADAVHTRELVASAARGWLPLIGDHEGYSSFVHVADAATAVVAALEVPSGTYNVVDDEPLTRAGHADVWTRILGRTVRLPPSLVGKLPRLSALARSQRLSNRRLREVSGWRPSQRSMREVWPRVAAALDLDGASAP